MITIPPGSKVTSFKRYPPEIAAARAEVLRSAAAYADSVKDACEKINNPVIVQRMIRDAKCTLALLAKPLLEIEMIATIGILVEPGKGDADAE